MNKHKVSSGFLHGIDIRMIAMCTSTAIVFGMWQNDYAAGAFCFNFMLFLNILR